MLSKPKINFEPWQGEANRLVRRVSRHFKKSCAWVESVLKGIYWKETLTWHCLFAKSWVRCWQVAQRGELYSLLCSNYFVISNYLFVERSDYFLERSYRKMERSDCGTKWLDTTTTTVNCIYPWTHSCKTSFHVTSNVWVSGVKLWSFLAQMCVVLNDFWNCTLIFAQLLRKNNPAQVLLLDSTNRWKWDAFLIISSFPVD